MLSVHLDILVITVSIAIRVSIFQIIAFDELKTDYKNPIDQCNSLNPVRIHSHACYEVCEFKATIRAWPIDTHQLHVYCKFILQFASSTDEYLCGALLKYCYWEVIWIFGIDITIGVLYLLRNQYWCTLYRNLTNIWLHVICILGWKSISCYYCLNPQVSTFIFM